MGRETVYLYIFLDWVLCNCTQVLCVYMYVVKSLRTKKVKIYINFLQY